MENITLKRTDSTWLYQWSPNGRFFFFINQANIRYAPSVRDHARNALNAVIAGLRVHVQGAYDKQTRILTIEP